MRRVRRGRVARHAPGTGSAGGSGATGGSGAGGSGGAAGAGIGIPARLFDTALDQNTSLSGCCLPEESSWIVSCLELEERGNLATIMIRIVVIIDSHETHN